MQFDSACGEGMNQALKLTEGRPTLSEINVCILNASYHRISWQCVQMVHSLLLSSFQSITRLCLTPICFLKSTSFPPLENLVSLQVGSCRGPADISGFVCSSLSLADCFQNYRMLNSRVNYGSRLLRILNRAIIKRSSGTTTGILRTLPKRHLFYS